MILFNLSFSYMSFCNILIVVNSISMYHVIFVYCSLIDDVLCTSQNKIMFCSVLFLSDKFMQKYMYKNGPTHLLDRYEKRENA